MRRRSRGGVLTRSQRQLMELQGYAKEEKEMDDEVLDEYIEQLDEKIDAAHAQVDMSWEDYESSSDDEGASDDDETDGEYRPRRQEKSQRASRTTSGFVSHVFWSSLGLVLIFPIFYYRWKYSSYPMNSSSFVTYFLKAIFNWITLFLLVCFIFAGICNTSAFVNGSLFKLPLSVDECALDLWSDVSACVITYGQDCIKEPRCQLPVGRFIGALVSLFFVFRFYSGRVQFLVCTLFALHHGIQQWQQYHIPAQDSNQLHILSIDPAYAYANETIHILVDGQNLYEGLSIGWVPYWSCSQHTPLSDCHVDLVAPLRHGGVSVAFPTVDQYTICVVPTGEAGAKASICFDSVRLRSKDSKSRPGWSLTT
ncbi:DNA helicase rad5 [Aphanomyces cochlioides]|nr:DNA helicase rad5 [Aphanomyces cochlioides]